MDRLFFLKLGATLLGWFFLSLAITQAQTLGHGGVDRAEQRKRIEQFQKQLIASPVMGLPSTEQLEALSPYLSNPLLTRLRAASQAQKAITQRSPMPEPPLVQGALFYSLFEGASRLVQVTHEGNDSSVLVTLAYLTQPNDPSPVRWTDRVMLVIENQQTVVDDIQFLGQWDFSRQGMLSDQLDAVIAAGQSPSPSPSPSPPRVNSVRP